MRLWNLKSGEQAVVKDFDKKLSKEIVQRLLELGIHQERKVECLKQSFLGSPKSFKVGDTVIGLDKEIAVCISVSK
ncbi:MAG: ferrous iron transport protein A [Oligoflexia bacterium]|nr:ferrous iron transport protein A [Oligoflexia bacterium]MBF0365042.1 ferrous iron transport protein A [Oligoflexia bacterium]